MKVRPLTTKVILVIFLICAVIDFVWGYRSEHSIAAGITYAVLALPETAIIVFSVVHFIKGD
jgi:hypothetical protein